tara:strand:- start:825 stop:2093 length:1269 start_codon:yes stop_codon:yes gene_type:complete
MGISYTSRRSKKNTTRENTALLAPLSGDTDWSPRTPTKIAEFDRVVGGGLVSSSVVLIGGDPGIGKSTILLQVVAQLSNRMKCIYITGEEAPDQIRVRAKRLKVGDSPAFLVSATNMRDILPIFRSGAEQKLIVIDSIQTIYNDDLDAAPGTVSQVRATAHELIAAAKTSGAILLLVGHVTKEGNIAGPRVLEHMVDTVLYFEGERNHQFRILRSVKNRYGPTNEIGVFEMTETGLSQVINPSTLFLGERRSNVVGTCVFGGMEGSRPLLVEIQALIASSPFGTPRRAVIGWDTNRLAMVIAVLEARCKISLSEKDIFLNVAGGLKINEPAADLAVAGALLSSLNNIPGPSSCVFCGEIGLSAEIRPVNQLDRRLKEATKLGFTEAITPPGKILNGVSTGMKVNQISDLNMLVKIFEKKNAH